ncbi:MAG: hypothetical protein ACTHM9_12100 [Gemmatimonadales bacterium]
MTNQDQQAAVELAGVPEIAVAKAWSYRKAYDSMLRGLFGTPIRRNGRLFVLREAVIAGRPRQ